MAILHISFLLLVSGVSILAVPFHKAHLYRRPVPLHKALPLHKAHLYREAVVRHIKTHINFKGNTPCYLTIEGNCTRDMNKTTINLSGGHPVEVTADNAAALRERLMHPGELKSPQGFRVRSGSDSSEERVPSIADYEPWEPSVPDFEGNPEVPVIPGPRSGGGGGGGGGGNAATGGSTTGGVGGGIDRGEAGEGAGESGGTETGEGVGAAGAGGAGEGETVGGGGTGAGGAGGGAGAGGAGGVGGSGGVGGAGGTGGTGGRARPPMFPVLPPVNSNPQLPALKPAQPQQPSKPGTGSGAGPQVPLIPQTIGPVINHSNQKQKPSSVTAALAGTFVPLGIVVGAAIAGLIGYRKWRRQHLPTSTNYQTMSQRAVVNA